MSEKPRKFLLVAIAFIGAVVLNACASLSEADSPGNSYAAQTYSSLYVKDEISINKKVIVECPAENSIMKRVTEIAIVDRLREHGIRAYAMSSYSSYSDARKKEGSFDYVLTVAYGDTYTDFGGAIASIDFECTVEKRKLLFFSEKIAKIVGSSISKSDLHLGYAESIEPASRCAGEAIADEYIAFARSRW